MLTGPQLMALIGARPATLSCLSLVGFRNLGNGFLNLLRPQAASLQHIRLEECYACWGSQCPEPGFEQPTSSRASQMSSGKKEAAADAAAAVTPAEEPCCSPATATANGAAAATAGLAAATASAATAAARLAFTSSVFLGFLSHCRRLQSLRLRHSCRLSQHCVSAMRQACPLLRHIALDGCDLVDGGFRTDHDAYSALETVLVYKCREVSSPLMQQSSAAAAAVTTGATGQDVELCREQRVGISAKTADNCQGAPESHSDDCRQGCRSGKGPSENERQQLLAVSTGDPRLPRRIDKMMLQHHLMQGKTDQWSLL